MHINQRKDLEIIDISVAIYEEMITYEGDPKTVTQKVKNLPEDGVTVSQITMGLHSGTHVDSPAHYFEDGKTIDNLNLNSFIGEAKVYDFTYINESIKQSDLEKIDIRNSEILLFKTKNSDLYKKYSFSKNFVYLDESGADYLIEKKIKAVGIDYLSIEKFESDTNYVHKRLLSNKIPIIEGLNLIHVKPGNYTLFCLPLKVLGGEAAPARCILIR